MGIVFLILILKKMDEEIVIAVKDIKIFNKLSKLAKESFKALGGKSLGKNRY